MSKTRQDSTILLQAGLNGLNQALTAAEIKYFVPIYDDLIDHNVRTNPLETSACVSSATRGLNTLTPDNIRGAYFFKETTAATQNWSVDISATSGWSYYSDTTGGYTSIQGELACWKSGSSVSAASCYGGMKAVSGASISGGVITGSSAKQCPAETGWNTSKLYDSVVYVGQRSTDDSAAAQYAVNLNSSVVGNIIFNKLLVFSRCVGGSYQPLACIALAEPIAIKNDGTGLSDITIEFNVNFTANLSNVPINVIADTSGYWYYTAKAEGIDSVNPLFTPGRVKIGADPFGIDTSAFVTMGGKGTSGLKYVDYFSDEDNKYLSYRKIDGSIVNISGDLPSSGGINESVVVGASTSSFGSIDDSVACVWKPAYTSYYNLILTNPSTGTLTPAHTVDGNHETSSWGGWGFDANEISAFQGKINHSIVNGFASGTSARYIIGIRNSVVVSTPSINLQGFSGTLAINSVLVSPNRPPQCENSVFVGTLNIGGTQHRIPFLSNSLVVGSNNMVVRTSTNNESEHKKGHYIRSQKPIVILGHDNSISANNNTIGDDTYSAYVFGSNVSATFGYNDCTYPHYIFGNGFEVSKYSSTKMPGAWTRTNRPIFEIGGPEGVNVVIGQTSFGPPVEIATLFKIDKLPNNTLGLPEGSLYVKTENDTKYVCIV